MKAYVYIYFDPTISVKIETMYISMFFEPFYIGKGTGNRYEWLANASPDQTVLIDS